MKDRTMEEKGLSILDKECLTKEDVALILSVSEMKMNAKTITPLM